VWFRRPLFLTLTRSKAIHFPPITDFSLRINAFLIEIHSFLIEKDTKGFKQSWWIYLKEFLENGSVMRVVPEGLKMERIKCYHSSLAWCNRRCSFLFSKDNLDGRVPGESCCMGPRSSVSDSIEELQSSQVLLLHCYFYYWSCGGFQMIFWWRKKKPFRIRSFQFAGSTTRRRSKDGGKRHSPCSSNVFPLFFGRKVTEPGSGSFSVSAPTPVAFLMMMETPEIAREQRSPKKSHHRHTTGSKGTRAWYPTHRSNGVKEKAVPDELLLVSKYP